ncbi:MAG: LysR family transcriptional regulator [Deltaproteobacteria bacterium]|nr:LysR family transcriptional regulator [Deltaproteobacteria bacterium]
MDLRDLRYFAAIAENGSMTAAAKALHVSQPTLTVAMQNLEEELGTQLFVRDRSGVKLTSTGEALLEHAREIFLLLERAEARVKGLEREDQGTFVLGSNESLGAYFLPDFMARFLRDHPSIELTLHNESSAAVRESVLERRTHFGIVVNPHPHPDLVIVELFPDAMDVMVAEDAPPPSRPLSTILASLATSGEDADVAPPTQRISWVDSGDPAFQAAKHRLLAGPLIYAGRVKQCQELCDQLAGAGLLSTRKLVCGDLELVKSLALAGIGPALLPRRVAAYGHEGRLVRLHPNLPFIPDTICLIYRADMHRTKAAMKVKDEIVAYGKKVHARG